MRLSGAAIEEKSIHIYTPDMAKLADDGLT
jgi:hypothetical protein